MLKSYFSKGRAAIAAAILLLLFLTTKSFRNHSTTTRWTFSPNDDFAITGTDTDLLPCQKLPGGEDVVFVMRTGATEIQDKLPAHLNTTFRCYQDYLIFSDFEEAFEGYPVRDVLAPTAQGVIETNPDFALYLRLREFGRADLRDDELSGTASFEGGKDGKKENPGWALDKWKFLPMLNLTLTLRPDKNWFVFVESDSYPVYSNILQWLQTRDPSEPLYYGSEVQIGPDQFAHGGSVFVMSRSAIEIGAQYYAEHEDELNGWTAGHWAGDCVLGKTLRDAGVPLTWGWPLFQGGHPEKMNFVDEKMNRKLWCTPALSYHHFSPSELEKMWRFEQVWIQSRLDQAPEEKQPTSEGDFSDILEHRDVFKNFVLPKLREGRSGPWNNMSPDLVENELDNPFEYCDKFCESHADCLQFVAGNGECRISTNQAILGEPGISARSRWMPDRIERWMDGLDRSCSGFEGWPEN